MYKIKKKKIYGWSRKDFSLSEYFEPNTIDKLEECFFYAKKTGAKISLRGAGRSYGDNTLNDKNIVLNYTQSKKIINFNSDTGVIEVTGCCRILDLLLFTIPKGWILNVSPASQYVSISGAVSNNVHGKNCYQKGYFGDYVEEITFYSHNKGTIKCSTTENKDYFYSILGGLGLLGVIISIKIQLRKITTISIITKNFAIKDMDHCINQMLILRGRNEFNIGSLNFTRFKSKNLGKIYSSDFDQENRCLEIKNLNPKFIIYIINNLLKINRLSFFANNIEYLLSKLVTKKPTKFKTKQDYFRMNFLGDYNLPLYNKIFKNGFVEYQMIFNEKHFLKAIEEIKVLLKKFNYCSYLSSFKAYKKADPNIIFSINITGFCITLDIPYEKSKNFNIFIRRLNDLTLKYSGIVYLGKNSYLNNEEFKSMYPKYKKFLSVKNILDPSDIIQSDMSKRFFAN